LDASQYAIFRPRKEMKLLLGCGSSQVAQNYTTKWEFISKIPLGAVGAKNGQIPFCFFFLFIDLQGVHLHG
jgi:hypothetical protein